MQIERGVALRLLKDQDDHIEAFLNALGEPHSFLQRFYDATNRPRSDFATFVRKSHSVFAQALLETRRNPLSEGEIPALTHRIWLTSVTEPRLPPADYVDNYLNAILALPRQSMHLFWTNSDAVSAILDSKAKQIGCKNLILMSLDFFPYSLILSKIHKLIEDRKFVLAVGILKFVVLDRFGGIYSDLGINFSSDVFALIMLADCAYIVGDSAFFQTSFYACPPGSNVAAIFLAILNSPGALNRKYAIAESEVSATDEVHISAGPGMTVCSMLFMPRSTRALMLAAQSGHLQSISQQSWYGDQPKHGNVLISKAEPTFLHNEIFRESNEIFKSYVRVYGHSPILGEQLYTLINLHTYFEEYPTRFCRTFFFHGTDKALRWHNYGYLYNFLLPSLISNVRNILEVGIGTYNLDVPSTMGSTGVAGASLRAWKELFPFATIVGADVDTRILFQEPGIETYWVDQTRADAVAQMFLNVGPRDFDLIVDDGLHTFEANRTLLVGAYPHVAEGGLYIVEDVANDAVSAWHDFLTATGCVAAIARIPHSFNDTDNRIIIIPGGQRSISSDPA